MDASHSTALASCGTFPEHTDSFEMDDDLSANLPNSANALRTGCATATNSVAGGRRSWLLATAASLPLSLWPKAGLTQEVPPIRLPPRPGEDSRLLEIDDTLRAALSALRTFPGGRARAGGRFLALLSVDCVWCRFQYAANRKLLHTHSVRYALTYTDSKFASLVDPALLGGWQTAESAVGGIDSVAREIFHGVRAVDPNRHSASVNEAIERQRDAVRRVLDLLRERFAPRGISVRGIPTTVLLLPGGKELRLVSVGFAPHNYYPFVLRPRGDLLRLVGLRDLRSYVAGEPQHTDNAKGVLPSAAWEELGKLFAVEQGNQPLGDPTAQGPEQAYVLFDPSDIHARTLWHQISVAEFYVSTRWIPVPDLEDDQSLASWIHLFRVAAIKGERAGIQMEKHFVAVMLGYEPKDTAIQPTAHEIDRMLQTKVLADRVFLATQRLPVVILRTPSGEVQWQTNPSVSELMSALGLA
jgi:hypothetical protein